MAMLEVKDLQVYYGVIQALKGISFHVNQGEVIALIGANGAGKTTLSNLICGFLEPSNGKIELNGKDISPLSVKERGEHIGIVMQNPNQMISKPMIYEEVALGLTVRGVPEEEIRERVYETLKICGLYQFRNWPVSALSFGQKKRVTIASILVMKPEILILDEPTSALTFKEVESLFKVVKDLKAQGIGIIYITHRLDEVFEISTDVGIMRDGRITLMGKIEEFTKAALVKGLLPDATDQQEIVNKNTVDYSKDPVLELKNYSGYGFKDISLKVYPGEILGVAGVVGAGRTEMAQTIFGMDKVLGGKVYLDGNDITGLSTQKVMKAGVNYVSEDRHADGIFKISSVAYNITSGVLSESFMGKVFLNQKKEKSLTQQYIDDFRIKVTGQEQEVGSLSGGNQQKVVIGHALATNPKLIILDEPTRGIDAGARTDVYNIIKGLSKKGLAVLLISSDMEEIIELSDRAVTIHQGRLNCEFDRADINQENLTKASFGVIGKEKES